MKKLLFASSILIFFLSGSPVTALASDSKNIAEGYNPIIRVSTTKIWFKGVPPKTYNGKLRINYYKSQGGYIGGYLRN